MTRRQFFFPSRGNLLAATLDEGALPTALLIVTGGNEIRAGAFAGQAQLAAPIAQAGYPVLRYDRAGVGDSGGVNRGYRDGIEDIPAAVAALRQHMPQVERIVGFGNCDAATALALAPKYAFDALALANPWTFASETAPDHTPAAIRQRYAARLRDPRQWQRLLSGGVNLGKLVSGLRRAASPGTAPLAEEMRHALAAYDRPVRFLLAGRDRTAAAFREHWPAGDRRIELCPGASHAFVEPAARDWLTARLLDLLAASG